jgi:hypothetical protein
MEKLIMSNDFNSTLTAFSTTSLIGLAQRSINEASELEKFFILDKDEYFYKPISIPNHEEVCIARLVASPTHVQPFFHPIVYISKHEKVNNKIKLYVFSDCRAFYNAKSENKIRNQSDFNFISLRSQMDANWFVEKEAFVSIKDFITDTFSNWLGNLLYRSMNAPLYVVSQWKMIAAIYYLSFFIDDIPHNKEILKAYLYKNVTKITRLPLTMLEELFSNHEETIYSLFINQQQYNPNFHKEHGMEFKQPIIALCELLSKITDNTIMINHHMVYNIVANAGLRISSAAQINTVSLEHPTTFITMMYYAKMKGFNSDTKLGLEIKNIVSKHDVNLFDRVLTSITTQS